MSIDFEKAVLWFLIMDFDQMPENGQCAMRIYLSEGELGSLLARVFGHLSKYQEQTEVTVIKQYLIQVDVLKIKPNAGLDNRVKNSLIDFGAIYRRLDVLDKKSSDHL